MLRQEKPEVIQYLLAVRAAKSNGIATFERLSDFMHSKLGYSEREIIKLHNRAREADYIDSNFEMHYPNLSTFLDMIRRDPELDSDYKKLSSNVSDYLREFLSKKETRLEKEKARGSTSRGYKKLRAPKLAKIKFDEGPSLPATPIAKSSDRIITLDELTRAVQLAIDKDMEYEVAKGMASHVLGFFGYQTAIIDNSLTPEDRQLFYMLEDYDILSKSSEETTLWDGRDWRVHHWILTRKIHELLEGAGDEGGKSTREVDVYKDIFSSDLWAQRGTGQNNL